MAVCVFCALLLSGCSSAPVVAVKSGYDFSKISRVALIDFQDYKGQPGSGQVVSQAFEPYLMQAGYNLVERSQVQKLLQEQRFSQAGAVDPKTAASLGKLLGVQALILGSVTGSTQERSETYMRTVQNVSYQPVYQAMEYKDRDGNVRTRQEVSHYDVTTTNDPVPETYAIPAFVGVSVRMVDAATGEVLWSGSVRSRESSLHEAADAAAKSLMTSLRKAWPVNNPKT